MDDQVAALQIDCSGTLQATAQEIEILLVECTVIPLRRANSLSLYAMEITFTSQEATTLLKALPLA